MEAPVASAHKKEAHFSVFRELGSGQDVLCRAEEEWQGAFGGEKGKTGWRATGVGLEAIILRLSSKRKGPNSGKERRGFLAALVKGWKI